jgi:molybdopterin-guanine dinucleotide biosynthesis protein A
MTGIVLAGGESRRMGVDKPFLKVAGMPMVERVINALRAAVDTVIVVTNKPDAYTAYNVEVTTDAFKHRSSLVGVYSGLLRSRDEYNFVVACDMPFLNSGLVRHMCGLATGECDAVLPKIGELIEPLHAVYRKTLLPVIKEQIERGQPRLRNILVGKRIRYVTEEEIGRFDPLRRSFINLNTVKEYEEAACLDLECRS